MLLFLRKKIQYIINIFSVNMSINYRQSHFDDIFDYSKRSTGIEEVAPKVNYKQSQKCVLHVAE